MEAASLSMLVAGAACAGFVNGLAGFGTALFALGFWLQVFPPLQAVAISLVVSVITGLQGLWVVRRQILDQPRRLLRFVIPGVIGIPLGVYSLIYVDPRALKLLIAGFLILYGLFFLARRSLPRFERRTPVADSVIGFAGGVLGGLAGLSGALPAMWCALRPWPRAETRAVLQPYNAAILALTAVYLGLRGAYDWRVLQATGIALVISI
ncbi:MAG: sulfite exporter TauE/SafE family protein, partial [Rhodobacter sp.]|nr:sulfite exporter TauE/SafE family protein [Rhodobacter sp.]